MTPRRKRRLTYITIAVFFLLGGVEYAVILPTLWLYLNTRFHAPMYFLGLVLSAFSVADLLASPHLGRWSDRSHNTKLVLLVANLPQIGGCLMYFIGISPWMLVASRFVAGLGSGVGSALFADIARVTSSDERTAVLSVFMSMRQIGLLFGPGCNLFLRHLDFDIGPFLVDKYTSPGLFMAVCWMLHELLTLFMFWNLPALHLQEQLERVEANCESTPPVNVSESQPAAIDTAIMSRDCAITPPVVFIPQEPFNVTPSAVKRVSLRTTSSEHLLDISDTSSVTMSNEFIEEAEVLMHAEVDSSSVMEPAVAARDLSVFDAETAQHLSWPCDADAVSPILRTNSDSFLQRRRQFYGSEKRGDEVNILPTQTDGDAEVPQILRESSAAPAEPEPPSNSLTWWYYYDEFIREEIIAILGMVFIAFFNQVSMETIVTPLTQKLLHWDELQNSLLFCGAGIEVILVFGAILLLSRRLSDRTLILIGLFLESATIAFLLWFIPQATDDNININLLSLLLALVVDLLGIPMVAVASNSLYSKITRKETQGLAQGIRRIFVQCGLILGPLWAGSMLQQPYYMFGVMLAVNLLLTASIALLFLVSTTTDSTAVVIPPTSARRRGIVATSEGTLHWREKAVIIMM